MIGLILGSCVERPRWWRRKLLCHSRRLQFFIANGPLRTVRHFLYQRGSTTESSFRSCHSELFGCRTFGRRFPWYSLPRVFLTSGIPLAAAVVTRLLLLKLLGPKNYQRRFIDWIAPLSLIGLLFTIIILFASQGKNVVNQIVLVVRVAAPLICYFAIIFISTLFVCRKFRFEYRFAAVQSFTAASNNFELAIAVAIATFGANSNQALAATVGPLIEVPVLLSLVYLMKWLHTRWRWGKDAELPTGSENGSEEPKV
jgi:Sodium Bile acid symporter family